jgi:hypothetical protein
MYCCELYTVHYQYCRSMLYRTIPTTVLLTYNSTNDHQGYVLTTTTTVLLHTSVQAVITKASGLSTRNRRLRNSPAYLRSTLSIVLMALLLQSSHYSLRVPIQSNHQYTQFTFNQHATLLIKQASSLETLQSS